MNSIPLFPAHQPWQIWAIVVACFAFWLVAYALIIKRGIQDKSFGMPVAALCANITWELLFSHVYLQDFLLVRIGNNLWVLVDVVILVTVWKYGPADFTDTLVRKWLHWLILLGITVALVVELPFVAVYNDRHGYFLGWAAALMMSVLYIAMLQRRGNVQGQSCYIALSMFLGNVAAYLWCRYFPDTPPLLDGRVNLAFVLTTGFFNVAYLGLLHRKCKELGINPWTRF